MNLSILIINWKSAHYLRPCLASVFRETQGIEFEVIVVDNASYDGSAELIRTEFPQVTFIQNDQNQGFAKANNLGYRHSSGEILVFLNPDTEVIGNALPTMCSHLRSMPKAGALGCLLLNSDLSVQTSCVQAFPTILSQMLDGDYLRQLFPRWSIWGTKALVDYGGNPVLVDAVSGACLMVERTAFEAVGLFSEDYFMYTEDLELCYKIWKAGYSIYHINDAKVIHHGKGSAGMQEEKGFSTILQKQTLMHFFRQTRGSLYSKLYKVVLGCSAILRLMLVALMLPIAFLMRDPTSLIRALKKWYKVFRWSIGLEVWAEKAGS